MNSGAGLAFVSYPEVLAKFDLLPQLFAVLFFLMLITLGLGSAVGFLSAVTTTICDSFPGTPQKFILKMVHNKENIVLKIQPAELGSFQCCAAGFGVGLFYVTPGGQSMLEMVDYYAGTLLILVLASAEIIAISWVYGANTLTRDFDFMLNTKLRCAIPREGSHTTNSCSAVCTGVCAGECCARCCCPPCSCTR